MAQSVPPTPPANIHPTSLQQRQMVNHQKKIKCAGIKHFFKSKKFTKKKLG